MLISVSVASGEPWMRPFVRRVCRVIAEARLGQFDPEQSDSPRYAACVLVDPPALGSARVPLTIALYTVAAGNRLTRVVW